MINIKLRPLLERRGMTQSELVKRTEYARPPFQTSAITTRILLKLIF